MQLQIKENACLHRKLEWCRRSSHALTCIEVNNTGKLCGRVEERRRNRTLGGGGAKLEGKKEGGHGGRDD